MRIEVLCKKGVMEILFTPESPQRLLQQGFRGPILWRVGFPRKGAVAADPSRHAAEREQGGGCRGDGAGEHVHVVDQSQVVGAEGSVQPIFEDEIHQEDGVRCAGGMLPDELNEEAVVVRGQNPVFVGIRGGGIRILLGDHIVEAHFGWMSDAELIFAEETCQAERCGGGDDGIRRGRRGAGHGRQRRIDCNLDLHIGIRSRFEAAGSQ